MKVKRGGIIAIVLAILLLVGVGVGLYFLLRPKGGYNCVDGDCQFSRSATQSKQRHQRPLVYQPSLYVVLPKDEVYGFKLTQETPQITNVLGLSNKSKITLTLAYVV
jgi:hypothetical protein